MAINGTPAMSWGDFLNIPDGTQVLNHSWDQCVALVNLYNEGVLGGGFVQTPNAIGWWDNKNVANVHGFERVASNPQVGDIGIASFGLYDSVNGHIFVVTRAWDGTTFGTMEQNGGARYVARYNRTMANVDGFLRPINQSAITSAPAAAPVSSRGDRVAAEGNDWTYWIPSTQDQATVQVGLTLAGTYSGPLDGNLTSDASVRAIKLVAGNFGFFDLRFFDGQMNKNLCHGILLMAQAHGGYTGRMDFQIDGHVWAAFDSAIRATAPAPVTPPPIVPVDVPVVDSTEPVIEPVVEPVVETPIVDLPIVEVVEDTPVEPVTPTATGTPLPKEKYVMSAEESAKQYEQIAALPAADLGAIIKSSKNRMIAYSIFALVSMIVTNASVAYAALETPFPAWLIVSVSVIGNLSVPFAALAVANARSANAKS
jgi:hypothetical protein